MLFNPCSLKYDFFLTQRIHVSLLEKLPALPKTVFLQLKQASESPGRVLRTDGWALPQSSWCSRSGLGPGSRIFNKVQVLLLVQGLYSENHRWKQPSANSSPWHVRPPITLLPSSFTTSGRNPHRPLLPTPYLSHLCCALCLKPSLPLDPPSSSATFLDFTMSKTQVPKMRRGHFSRSTWSAAGTLQNRMLRNGFGRSSSSRWEHTSQKWQLWDRKCWCIHIIFLVQIMGNRPPLGFSRPPSQNAWVLGAELLRLTREIWVSSEKRILLSQKTKGKFGDHCWSWSHIEYYMSTPNSPLISYDVTKT